jgi:hypothetical protein
MTTTNKHAGPISAGFRGLMLKRNPVSDTERQSIIAALKTGAKTFQVAREHCRGESTVREIARAAGLTTPAPKKEPKAAAQEICVRLPDPVAKLVDAAAARRNLSSPELVAAIVVGVVTRSSIDRPPDIDHAIELCADYQKKRENHECAERKLGRGIDVETALSVDGG